jgi:hypothetical protein
MVEYKELFFTHFKNIIQRNKFSRDCSYRLFLLYTKNQRIVAGDSLKNVIFQKLRFALFSNYFSSFSSFIHTGWHRQHKL